MNLDLSRPHRASSQHDEISDEGWTSECMVSVIVPTWNSMSNGKSVRRTIQSVLEQGLEKVEIIVVDNTSTDATPEVCAQSGVFFHQVPSTRSSARNYGMSVAQGRFLLFLDSDEELEPGILQASLQLANERNFDAISLKYTYLEEDSGGDLLESPLNLELRFREPVRIPRLYRRNKVGGLRFPEELDFGEDFVFYDQFLKRNPKIGLIDWGVLHYSPPGLEKAWKRSFEYGRAFQVNHSIPNALGFLRRLSILNGKRTRIFDRESSASLHGRLHLVMAFLLVKYAGFAAGYLSSLLLPGPAR